MPIRINLKEVFSADSQVIAVDKINFNFNKLLELGIGEVGPQGIQGPQGAAGPIGPTGPTGESGSTWYVGIADPNTLTFTGLLDGDFFLNTDDLTIWRWDEGSSTWTQIIDFTVAIDDYLATTTQTFVRGFNSPQENRIIVFPNRNEIGAGDNDILFLSNIDETVATITNLSTSDILDGGISQIYSDSTAGPSSSRIHLELGTVYQDENGDTVITKTDNNLKVKYYQYDNGDNTFTSVSQFSISKLEANAIDAIDRHGAFRFITPNNNGIGSEVEVYFGSNTALSHLTSNAILSTGIVLKSGEDATWLELGITYDLFNTDSTYPYKTIGSEFLNIGGLSKDFAIINFHGEDVSGLFVNRGIYQDNGSIIQVGTGPLTRTNFISSLASSQNSVNYSKHLGMAMYGDRVYAVHGNPGSTTSISSTASVYDKYHVVSITDPSNPKTYVSQQSLWTDSASSNFLYGVCDIDIVGDYAYLVANHDSNRTGTSIPFAIAKIDEKSHGQLTLLYSLDTDYGNGAITETNTTLNDNLGYSWKALAGAYRVKVQGNIAYVINKYNDSDWMSGNATEGEDAGAYLTAIDISSPNNPIIVNTALSRGQLGSGSGGTEYGGYRHLSLDVNKSIAATLTWERIGGGLSSAIPLYDEFGDSVPSLSSNRIILNLYDLSDKRTDSLGDYTDSAEELPIVPSLLRFGAISVESSLSGPLTDYGAVAIFRNYAIVCWENQIKVYTIPTTLNTAVTSISSTAPLASYSEDSSYYATDCKVSGRFLYVSWINPSQNSLITKHDLFNVIQGVSDPLIPISSIVPQNISSYNNQISRLLLNGKHIYATFAYPGVGSPHPVSFMAFSQDGIISPAASIDSIQTSTLTVAEKARIGDSLNVGYSANVGSGGISTTGNLAARGINGNFHNFGVNTPSELDTTQYHNYPLANILPYNNVIQSGMYLVQTTSQSTDRIFWRINTSVDPDPVVLDNTAATQSVRMNWTRIGNVVSFSGFVYLTGVSGFINGTSWLFPYPIYPADAYNSNGMDKLSAYGTATVIYDDGLGDVRHMAATLGSYDLSSGVGQITPIKVYDVINGGTAAASPTELPMISVSVYVNNNNIDFSNVYFSGHYLLVSD